MMTTLMVDLPVELATRLKCEADRRQISTTMLIQETLRRIFPTAENDSPLLSIYELTRPFCGSMQSGLGGWPALCVAWFRIQPPESASS